MRGVHLQWMGVDFPKEEVPELGLREQSGVSKGAGSVFQALGEACAEVLR